MKPLERLTHRGAVRSGAIIFAAMALLALSSNPYLAETNPQTRLEWIAALDKIEALKPTTVIAGHEILDGDDSPGHIEATRKYLRDFNRLNEKTKTAPELYERMLQLYPDRINPGSLWGASHAAKR